MYHASLRAALKAAFPNRYNILAWKGLLAEFVDIHVEAYRLNQQYRESNPEAPIPTLQPEAKEAIELLAKQEGHSYLYLAFVFYLHQPEMAKLMADVDFYKKQAAAFEQLVQDYKHLSDRTIAQIGNNDNL